MQFESWAEFWAMGGYGFFVWLAVVVTFAAMAILVFQTFIEGKQLLRTLKLSTARQQRMGSASRRHTL